MPVGRGPNIVTDGLILAADPANKKSYPGSGTTWYDLMGNSVGSLNGGTTFLKKHAGVMAFDGTDDWVNFPTFTELNTTVLSISWWVKHITLNYDKVSMYKGVSWPDRQIFFWERSGLRWVYSNDNDATRGFVYDIPVQNGWNNIVGTYDGSSTVSVYYNGVLFGTDECTSTYTNTSPLTINATSNNRHYGGVKEVSAIHIYNRVLTPKEALQNYNALKGRFQ